MLLIKHQNTRGCGEFSADYGKKKIKTPKVNVKDLIDEFALC